MALRYVGTTNWERTIVDDDGKFVKQVRTQPGTIVEDFVDEEGEKKILSVPRFLRSFVEADGPEDTYSDKFNPGRMNVAGNASAYPELDFGSTVQPRQAIFVTPDDNPEGFTVADPNRGPAVDNELLRVKNEAREVGQKAEAEALTKRQQEAKRATTKPQASSGNTQTRTAEGGQKSNDGNTGS